MNRQLPSTRELADISCLNLDDAGRVREVLRQMIRDETADVYTGAGSAPYRWYIWINKGRYKLGEWAFSYIHGGDIQPV